MKKGLLCGLLLITMFSCMKHEDLYNGKSDSEKKKEEYEKNFPLKDIDPEQNWNMAKQVMVNVTVNYGGENEYTIKMYSDNPRIPEREAYLLGKFTVKDGTSNTLAVDMVSDSESVYVCCVDAANGSVMKIGTVENEKVAVSFGTVSGRAVSGRADDGWQIFDVKDIYALVKPGTGIFRESHTPKNVESVMTSYEFTSRGSFKIYPVFGQTGGKDKIGYYYYNPNDVGGTLTVEEISLSDPLIELPDWFNGVPFLQYYYTRASRWLDWVFYPGATSNVAILQDSYTQSIRSKGYQIDVTEGYKVGFYVKNGNRPYLYSNKNLNQYGYIYSAVIYNEGNSTPQYIGLEDNNGRDSDFDCNDIIFSIAGNPVPPEVTDPDSPDKEDKPATWMIACEDLGNTDDFDFNDVVFGVSHVAGTTKASVIPYAAGGTLAADIYYNNKNLGEIHNMLGVSTTTMTNTTGKGNPGKAIEIDVNSDFTMSSGNMGGFSLKIGNEKAEICAPEKGKAPQMICAPGDWAWPTERTNIFVAYPGFGEWGANYEQDTWWKNPMTDKVVK